LSAIQLKTMPPHGEMVSYKQRRLSTVACIGKGGAGKSTTATNLAVIARLAGLRSAIIDADPQASSSVWRGLRDRNDIPVVRCSPLSLETTIAVARRAGIDLVFVDMAPGLHHVPEAAQHADLVLIPAPPTLFDLKVTSDLIQILNSAACRFAVILNAAPPVREMGEARWLVRRVMRSMRSDPGCGADRSRRASRFPTQRFVVLASSRPNPKARRPMN
jgi:MinD superfamily P-loop ATPase